MATKKTAPKKTTKKTATKKQEPALAKFFATPGRLFNAIETGRVKKGTYAKIVPGDSAGSAAYQKIRIGTAERTIYEGDLMDFLNALAKRGDLKLTFDRLSRGDLPAIES